MTIVQGPPRLADREDPQIGELLGKILEEDGIRLVLGRRAVAVRCDGGERVVELDDGGEARGAEIVSSRPAAVRGRRIGLETVGSSRARAASRSTSAAAQPTASGRSGT